MNRRTKFSGPGFEQVLYLKSRRRASSNDVTLVTQSSCDRLEHLKWQAKMWAGSISAAVYIPAEHRSDPTIKKASKMLKEMHAEIERTGQALLNLTLVVEYVTDVKNAASNYPINFLRNVALKMAKTELVLLLDVDFLPSRTVSKSLLLNKSVHDSILRYCQEEKMAIVLPSFEPVNTGDLQSLAEFSRSVAEKGKEEIAHNAETMRLQQFAADVFPQGHASTDYEKWLDSPSMYTVRYSEGYEPYVICSRRLTPWYDERFRGYGKNKVVHLFHLAALGFVFAVHPDWFVISQPHPPSKAWENSLGPERLPGIFHRTKLMYETAKDQIRKGITPDSGQTRLNRGKKGTPDVMGHWPNSDRPKNLQVLHPTFAQALCELRLSYKPRKLKTVRKLSFLNELGLDSITLCTTCTPDRFDRLENLVEFWDGPISVGVYYNWRVRGGFWGLNGVIKWVAKFHCSAVSKGCDIALCVLVDDCKKGDEVVGDLENDHDEFDEFDEFNGASDFGRMRRSSFVPINSMRNASLDMVQTDAVYLLDVDLAPCKSLHTILKENKISQDIASSACSRQAFVIPSFEASNELTTDSGGENCRIGHKENGCESCRVLSGDSGGGLLYVNSDVHEIKQCKGSTDSGLGIEMGVFGSMMKALGVNVHTQDVVDTAELSLCDFSVFLNMVKESRVIPFHSRNYPVGHCPVDVQKWVEMSNRGGDLLDASYDVDYVEGFEPFVIVNRNAIPKFDERFAGYGYDKVSFFLHLHSMGFKFTVLPRVYAMDIPHNHSNDWHATFGKHKDKLQAHRVRGLYTQFKRHLQMQTSHWPCAEGSQGSCQEAAQGLVNAHMPPDAALKGMSLVWSDGFGAEYYRAKSNSENAENDVTGVAVPWEGTGWRLSARQGLENCTLTTEKASTASRTTHKVFLSVNVPEGTWSPSGCREAGLPVGGVAARQRLSEPIHRAVLQYHVQFGKDFAFGRGGSLPGLYCNKGKGIRVSLGWRMGGQCVMQIRQEGGSITPKLQQGMQLPESSRKSSIPGATPSTIKRHFTQGQWHLVQIELNLIINNGSGSTECAVRAWIDEQVLFDQVLIVEVDNGGVEKYDRPVYGRIGSDFRGNGVNGIDGVLLTCFHGGGTSEWAAPKNGNILFRDFAMWCAK